MQQHWLPLVAHLRSAEPGAWRDDLLAGMITAILIVPQGMAYAMLAGLSPEVGLYASILPPIIYALFGSSRAMSVGPAAIASLMVTSALTVFAGDDSAAWVSGAIILAAEAGALLLLLGIFRLGALVNFISHPVLSGFISGAAILIIASQLRHLLGISLPPGSGIEMIGNLFSQLPETQLPTLAFGGTAVVILLLSRKPMQNWLTGRGMSKSSASLLSRSTPLLLVLLGSLIAALLQADTRYGLAIVGSIPAGIPLPSLEHLWADGWADSWGQLAPSAMLIALIAYIENISIGKALAARRRQKINANQELTALGLANMVAALVSTLPVAASFSRSAVNFEAGARSQLATIVTATLVASVALFFSQWFYYLPNAVLAALIVVACSGLIDIGTARQTWAYDRADGGALLTTAVMVVVFGIEVGLSIGIGLSLALYLWRTSQPHMAVIGQVPGTEHFRNIDRHQVDTLPHVLMLRVDENLYFANIGTVEQCLLQQLHGADELRHVVLVLSAVNYIDASALESLEHLNEDLEAGGITLHLAEVKGPVMDRLKHTAFGRALGEERVYLSNAQAMAALA